MIVRKTFRLYPVQAAFCHSKATYRGFIGGRGSGKSKVGAFDMIRRAKRGRTYLIASPTGVLLNDTTFPTFKEIARELMVWDADNVRLNPYPTVTLSTGATIRFRTAEDPEKMRGPNISGCWLDEASLMHENAFKIVIACLREQGEQGWLSATATPKGVAHWTYERFGKPQPDTELFHARTKDNPFLPPDFHAKLARQYTSGVAEQELEGRFVDASDDWQVIPTAWIRAAMARWTPEPPAPLSAIGVDVARGGGDKTVLAPRHQLWFAPLEKYPGSSTPTGTAVADLISRSLRTNPHALLCIDTIGVGASAYDCCVQRGWRTLAVNFAESAKGASDRGGVLTFANLRAQAYWQFRELLDPSNPPEDAISLPPDEELLADLAAPHWTMETTGVRVEKKENIVKRLGRSPDCFVAGTLVLTAYGNVPIEAVALGTPVWTRDGWRRVIGAGPTEHNAETFVVTFSDGRTLQGSGNHPVFVREKGWVSIDALVIADTIETCNHETLSNSTASRSFGSRKARACRAVATTTRIQKAEESRASEPCTVRFGDPLSAKYQQGTTSTTKTKTLSTTTSAILSALPVRSTANGTAARAQSSGVASQEYVYLLPRGTVAHGALLGMLSMGATLGSADELSGKYVKSAKNHTTARGCEILTSSAQDSAGADGTTETRLFSPSRLARFAAKSLWQHQGERSPAAPVRVVAVKPAGNATIFNLTVEGTHEYYANGVLVHNCADAVVIAALTPNVLPED